MDTTSETGDWNCENLDRRLELGEFSHSSRTVYWKVGKQAINTAVPGHWTLNISALKSETSSSVTLFMCQNITPSMRITFSAVI